MICWDTDHNTVVVYDGFDVLSNHDDGTVLELSLQDMVNQGCSPEIALNKVAILT